MADSIANPIINSPYEAPQRHFEIGTAGPTGTIVEGRRPSESFIPIAQARKGRRLDDRAIQGALDFDGTGERRERNSLLGKVIRRSSRPSTEWTWMAGALGGTSTIGLSDGMNAKGTP